MKFINKQKDIHYPNKLIEEYSKEFNLTKETIKLIFSRGITKKKDIIDFLNPSINQYFNPFALFGMNEGCNKIKEHIAKKSKIVIVGDYDCDGICATAILYKYFESINYKVNYFLPNRFTDGYGLTLDTVDKINEMYTPNLIITVDCGISCHVEVEHAKLLGIEMVVTDHHEIPEILPNCIFIDPKYEKNNYPFKELCGAGVAFKLVQALSGLNTAILYDSIAMIATVADIVPLISENRAIVYNGLKNREQHLPLGIKMLIDFLKLEDITSTDISFKIAPKLNTAGRLGDASLAFKLFIENDKKELLKIINELDAKNTERINYCNEIAEECLIKLDNINISETKVIVLHNNTWNHGVLGIVCSKLVDKFHKPVCLLTNIDGMLKGSVRSINGINIFESMTRCSHLLVKFGGHSQAGGLTIAPENLEEFKLFINQDIKNNYTEDIYEQVKYYDFDLNKVNIDINFIKELSILEPYGFKNEKPLFKTNCNNVGVTLMKNHDNHIKLKLNNFETIGFNLSNYYNTLNTNANKEILLDIIIDKYKNKENIKGFIKNIEINKLNTSVKTDIVYSNYLSQLEYLNSSSKKAYIALNETELYNKAKLLLQESKYGTVIIAHEYATYQKAITLLGSFIYNYECYNLLNQTGLNTLIFSPNNNEKINNYSNVIFLNNLICDGVLNNVISNSIYINSTKNLNYAMFNLSCDRSVFGQYHNALRNISSQNIIAINYTDYFNRFKKINPQLKNSSLIQFKFVTMVLEELGIININNNCFSYEININNKVTNQLTNSNIYNFINLLSKIK